MAQPHPFHTLLPPQGQALWRRALNLTANEHRAEDLVQTTLLKAWANRDKYKPDSQLRAWLFTILRNTYFSEKRKSWREFEDADGALAGALSEEPRQDHALALGELMAAIDLLPELQRKPILMMGAYGYSQAEVADACGCSVGTIKSRVSRSRATLTRILAHDEVTSAIQTPKAGFRHRPTDARKPVTAQHSAFAGS